MEWVKAGSSPLRKTWTMTTGVSYQRLSSIFLVPLVVKIVNALCPRLEDCTVFRQLPQAWRWNMVLESSPEPRDIRQLVPSFLRPFAKTACPFPTYTASWTRAALAQRMRLLVGSDGEQCVKWGQRLQWLESRVPTWAQIGTLVMWSCWFSGSKCRWLAVSHSKPREWFLEPCLRSLTSQYLHFSYTRTSHALTFLRLQNKTKSTHWVTYIILGGGKGVPKGFWGARWGVYLYLDLGSSHPPPSSSLACPFCPLPNAKALFEPQLTIPSFQSWSHSLWLD